LILLDSPDLIKMLDHILKISGATLISFKMIKPKKSMTAIPAFLLAMIPCLLLAQNSAKPEAHLASADRFQVAPDESTKALRNPLMGFRPSADPWNFGKEYASIAQCYIRWSEIENNETDSIQKIKDFCDQKWANVAKQGVRIIPRVYLDWDGKPENKFWPADMSPDDYTSEKFKQRLVRLIARLGECWDKDPRVAWVQLGMIGRWGEHHSPSPSAEIQKLMGDAITAAFPNKKVLVRHPDEFSDYKVGIYWDSWAHHDEIDKSDQGAGIKNSNQSTGRWKTQPIEGELAYRQGGYKTQPGDDPDDTLADPVHRDFLLDTIRSLHCSGLGWLSDYDPAKPDVQAGADEVQKAFGYRFVITHLDSPRRVESDSTLDLSLSVKNTGSAPFYYNWPVELSLLDPKTRLPIWKKTLDDIDIRQWLPGDQWDEKQNVYLSPATTYTFDIKTKLPGKDLLPDGKYIVALSILDPLGLTPSVRFAIKNYYNGGRHPLGMIGVGVDIEGKHTVDPGTFHDPKLDTDYAYATEAPAQVKRVRRIKAAAKVAPTSGSIKIIEPTKAPRSPGSAITSGALLIDYYQDNNASPPPSSEWSDAGVTEDLTTAAGGTVNKGIIHKLTHLTTAMVGNSGSYYGNAFANTLLADYAYSWTSSTVPFTVSFSGFETNGVANTLTSSLGTMSGNSFTLAANTAYRLYLFGAGDKDGQNSKFTFRGISKKTSSNIKGSAENANHYVTYDFTTGADLTDFTLEFTVDSGDDTCCVFNGLALIPMPAK
jgi:Domain of unknown function (DUF4832)